MTECAGCGRSLPEETDECPACNAAGPGLIGDSRKLAESGTVHHFLASPGEFAAVIAVVVVVIVVIARRFHEFTPALGTATLIVVGLLAVALFLGKLFGASSGG